MLVLDHIHWIDLPPFEGNRSYEGRLTCYRSNPEQIDATAIILTALMEHGRCSVSVMSMLRTHHEKMVDQLKSMKCLPGAGSLMDVNFFYAGETCPSADTLIVLPVMATGTRYKKLVGEISYRSTNFFDALEQQKFKRVIIVGEKLAWLSIGGPFYERLVEIPSTDYPVSDWYFKHDILHAVEDIFGDEH